MAAVKTNVYSGDVIETHPVYEYFIADFIFLVTQVFHMTTFAAQCSAQIQCRKFLLLDWREITYYSTHTLYD